MTVDPKIKLKDILPHFELEGRFLEVQPCGSGLINHTYVSCFRTGNRDVRYVHQRLNQHVFKEPTRVMENIERVISHAQEQIRLAGGDPLRETLNLVPTRQGDSFYLSPEGDCWRTYLFIDGARTYDQVVDVRHVYNASKAFGKFQQMMSSLGGKRLHETIPHFHNTRKRFEDFLKAVEMDAAHRSGLVKAEIVFLLRHADETSVIVDAQAEGLLPERVTHNDTKLNNVMIDDQTGDGICVIDLDTVMPGSVLYDFGDSVRIGACTATEDEQDLDKVNFDLAMFDQLAHGYLDVARPFLTSKEMDLLTFSARLITLEQALRFLTDYLNGDVYYRTNRANHNLDRCRTQLKMFTEMERNADAMQAQINRYRYA